MLKICLLLAVDRANHRPHSSARRKKVDCDRAQGVGFAEPSRRGNSNLVYGMVTAAPKLLLAGLPRFGGHGSRLKLSFLSLGERHIL